jgi:hypothetical protein
MEMMMIHNDLKVHNGKILLANVVHTLSAINAPQIFHWKNIGPEYLSAGFVVRRGEIAYYVTKEMVYFNSLKSEPYNLRIDGEEYTLIDPKDIMFSYPVPERPRR